MICDDRNRGSLQRARRQRDAHPLAPLPDNDSSDLVAGSGFALGCNALAIERQALRAKARHSTRRAQSRVFA
jgi:hypothetical protein